MVMRQTGCGRDLNTAPAVGLEEALSRLCQKLQTFWSNCPGVKFHLRLLLDPLTDRAGGCLRALRRASILKWVLRSASFIGC